MSKSFTSIFVKNFFFAAAYFVGMFMLLSMVMRFHHDENLLTPANLINFDGLHYNYIAHVEYIGYRNTFFPLFPFTWKLLGIGIYGIVIFNGLIFILSASLIAASFNVKAKEFLLMLSFPSLIFMFLPYSEALFFLASALILVGMKEEKEVIACIGFFLSGISRPVACIFVPAAFIMLFFVQNIRVEIKKGLLYTLSVLLGLLVVELIQHACTGDWLAFFHAENQWWGNDFKLPGIPITSWGGDNIVRLDATAFFVGLMASAALIYSFFRKISKGEPVKEHRVILFSMLYLAGICWFVMFTRGGKIFSLNRFVFATAFLFPALAAFFKRTWRIRDALIILFLLNVYFLMFGSYVHIMAFLSYFAVSVFVVMFFLIAHPARYISRIAYFTCLFGNIAMQIYFYHHFLNNGWVG